VPRVLHITEYIQGGIATYLDALLTEQTRTDDCADCCIVMCRQHASSLSERHKCSRILYDYHGRNISGLSSLLQAVRSSVREFEPDLVHLHSSFPGLICRLPNVLRRFPGRRQRPAIVYSSHGWSFLMEKSWLHQKAYAQVERVLSWNCERIICISENERRAAVVAGISRRKCRLVLNALPEKAPSAEPIALPPNVQAAKSRGDLIYLFVGRYDHQKGIDLLVNAFRRLEGKSLFLIAAGGGVLENASLKFVPQTANLGWATPGQVTFLLDFCDALIVPSRWEGFGLVAAEAARAGKAVICSSRGALPEVVEHGVTGIVFEDLSSNGIAEILCNVDRDLLSAMGDAAKLRFSKRFVASRMFMETQQVYRETLEERDRRFC